MAKRRGHGEGAIYQRADGQWCSTVSLGTFDGKRKRKTVYGKTRREVVQKLKELHSQQQQGINIAPQRITVAQFLDQWLTQVIAPNRRPRTHESYSYMVRLHIVPYIGAHDLGKLTSAHVQQWLNTLSATGLSPRTAQYARGVLQRALNRAIKWNYISHNAALAAETPRGERRTPIVLNEEQARRLLDVVRGHRHAVLYRFALSLGLRRGEVLGLQWSDIDFERKEIRIVRSLQREKGKLALSAPKTVAGKRILPLPSTLAQVLEEHRQMQIEERVELGDAWEEHGFVFSSHTGTAMEPRNLVRHFKEVLKLAGLPETMRFHDLRHSCATLLIAQGVNPRVVMEVLGHTKISTTMEIYAHVTLETRRIAADQLDALLKEHTEEDTEV